MPSVSRVASGALVALMTIVVHSRSARAQGSKPQTLPVIEVVSEDADDEAEALTGALRSRVMSAPGWTVPETTQSLRMLTAALRCPTHPDAACLQRIADHLKADRFVWGTLSKGGGGQVTADIHLWTRGKADATVKETYSDNLKDQNDDTLRKISSRILDRLTVGLGGTIVVHAGSGTGVVTVDGTRKETLEHGVATLVVSSGPHAIEVSVPGFAVANQNAVVAVGSSSDVNVELTPDASAPAPASVPVEAEPTKSHSSTQRALAWTGIIGGGALLVAGGALGVVFETSRSKLNSDRQGNYGNAGVGATIENPCSPPPGEANATTSSGCNARNLAQAVIIPEIAALSVGGALEIAGIVLLATDHKREPASTGMVQGLKRLRVWPQFGAKGASLQLSAPF